MVIGGLLGMCLALVGFGAAPSGDLPAPTQPTAQRGFARFFEAPPIAKVRTFRGVPVTVARPPAPGEFPFWACFSPQGPIDPKALSHLENTLRMFSPMAYQATDRWATTAAGGTGTLGNPITLTYSYVPDGVSIPGSNGEATSNNTLTATMNARFNGNTALWKSKMAACFARWGVLTGINFVEVSDDGAPFPDSAGSNTPGAIRGDIRIAAHPIDGGSNVLAYTFFPDVGDMVFDTAEGWGDVMSDYRFLRNTFMHEMGHGFGLGHVDPLDHTKLMEAFLNTNFDGPQDDDIRGGMRNYGDDAENNDNANTATDLGTLNNGTVTLTNRSTDSSGDNDWYRFTITQPLSLAATLTPVGSTYLVGPSGGTTVSTNTLAINNLNFSVYAANGTTVLASGNTAAAGLPESITGLTLNTLGNYYLRVQNASGSTNNVQRYTLAFTLSGGCTGITITGQPVSLVRCEQFNATFTVTANGTSPTYQWRKNTAPISGATNPSLTLLAVDLTDQGSYDCVITNSCTNVTSNAATLTVETSPTFTQAPSSQAVCAGSPVTLSANATGTPTITYQWRKNSLVIPGATSNTFTINAFTPGDVAAYDVVATNGCAVVVSSAASLSLAAGPAITAQPSATSACVGGTAQFSISATGPNITYQWFHVGQPISGATGPTLTLNPVASNSGGAYTCDVTNACGTRTSNPATLTLNRLPTILTGPQGGSACDGGAFTLSLSVDALPAPTYQWRRGNFVLPGATSNTLHLSPISPADAGSYTCDVTNACGTVTSNPATVIVNRPPTILSAPQGGSACDGSAFTLAVTVDSLPAPTYQWRKGGFILPGATSNTLFLSPLSLADAGSYECVITNTCGTLTTSAVSVVVNEAPQITFSPNNATVCEGQTASFTVVATGSPSYQWRRNTIPIVGATSSTLSFTPTLDDGGGLYDCVVTGNCGSATSAAATLTVNTSPTISVDPQDQAVCTGNFATFTVQASGGTPSLQYQWRRNTTPIQGATDPSYAVFAEAGAEALYDCVVTNACGSVISSAAALTLNTEPAIQGSSGDQFFCAGELASLSAPATGVPTPTYQWYKDNHVIPGQTSSTLNLGAADPLASGDYLCIATNACGTASVSMRVDVGLAPLFQGSSGDTEACPGQTVGFSAPPIGLPTPSLQWYKDGLPVIGATSDTLIIQSVQESDEGTYQVLGQNACGSDFSTPAFLNVLDACCDPDLNADGVVDQGDVDYIVNVISGGDNPTGIDPDFNHDGVADQGDVDALINVIAGGPCP